MYDHHRLEGALRALGRPLADRGEAHTVVAIGGGALALRGLIPRPTEDIDLVAIVRDGELFTAEPLPTSLTVAIGDDRGFTATPRQVDERRANVPPHARASRRVPETDGTVASMAASQFCSRIGSIRST